MKKNKILNIVMFLTVIELSAGADFALTDSQHLDVTTSYDNGYLYDSSTARVLSSGSINTVYVYHEATFNVEAGRIGKTAIPTFLQASENSIVNIYGGTINASFINWGNSNVNIFGGSINKYLSSYNSVTVNISGGYIADLRAYDTSYIKIIGYDFVASDGLMMTDSNVTGTGVLAGKWANGADFSINITVNQNTATILIEDYLSEPYCGDNNHPYPLGDLNKDCWVNLADLALIVANWLTCTAPDCDG